MKSPRLCVIGMATIDTIMVLRAKPTGSGAPLVAGTVVECPGGKGFVAAVAAANAGAFVELLAVTGEDWPPPDATANLLIRRELQVAAVSSRTWNLVVDGVDIQTVVYEAPPQAVDSTSQHLALQGTLMAADGVVLTTECAQLIRQAISILDRSGHNKTVTTSLNSATLGDPQFDTALVEQIMKVTDYLIVNFAEAADLKERLRLGRWQEASRHPFMKRLRGIVVTDGRDGHSYALRPFTEWRRRPAHEADRSPVCTLGAGDTFLGAAATCLTRGEQLHLACERGARSAAQNVMRLRSTL